ncbi:MAG: hypothetical protein K0S44_784 [Bacteroidetes bacterium]|jgi:hypothetical protein|nr:hypothetical protein [Bacteroidota bacterium]
MKPLFLLSLFLSITVASAQINNNGFENWTDMGNYEIPDQWGTINPATSHLNVYTVTKWYPGSPGNWFMKITSKNYGMNVLNGIAVYGEIDPTNLQPISGYPYTLRPGRFTGQWQHMIWGESQGSVCAILTKWNSANNKRDTIAIAYEELFDMAMQWEVFSVDFDYLSSSDPDSCMIVLKSSGDEPEVNDYLWVDDLAFEDFVGTIEYTESNNITVYPVPASDMVNIELLSNNSESDRVEIIDVTGKIIFMKELDGIHGSAKFSFNISSYDPGIYFIKISGSDAVSYRKIIKR